MVASADKLSTFNTNRKKLLRLIVNRLIINRLIVNRFSALTSKARTSNVVPPRREAVPVKHLSMTSCPRPTASNIWAPYRTYVHLVITYLSNNIPLVITYLSYNIPLVVTCSAVAGTDQICSNYEFAVNIKCNTIGSAGTIIICLN